MIFRKQEHRLVMKQGEEELWIEPWGKNGLRVRMTKEARMDPNHWALSMVPEEENPEIVIEEVIHVEPWYQGEEKDLHETIEKRARITNGTLTARIGEEGWITFEDASGKILLQEYWRNRRKIDRYCLPTNEEGRILHPITGSSDYRLTVRFEAQLEERIYGMGQYQDEFLDRKGCKISLMQRNSQCSVPFYISSLGYGFLWNNPAIGEVTFGKNRTEWIAESTKKMDYYITAGETPEQILNQYTKVTGRVPMMPEYGMGLWQSKLRYRNQEEVLQVVREYKRRGLSLAVIVIDFFHWTKQGEFRFDPADWPDPEAMIRELKENKVELMVSVWPTIDSSSEHFSEMDEQGYLVQADRGLRIHMNWMGETVFFDATNPGAREYVWKQCREHYFEKGIRLFWLDEAEPEYGPYDFDIYRYYKGPALQVSNSYPVGYARAFYEGMREEGMEQIVNLVRCAWAGSQKYGALVWSGDISSTFRALREQLQAGLNMGMAGIPWWTTDIGGFLGGDPKDPSFHELIIRWFEWAVFCPVMRMHGERQPYQELEETLRNGVKQFSSGQPNEVWSYGQEVYEILSSYITLREQLRPYIRRCMEEAHETGAPVMRTMYYAFPKEKECSELGTQYMFGSDLLVAPVLYEHQRERTVYLPAGHSWRHLFTKNSYMGGAEIEINAPIEQIPVFVKEDSNLILSCFSKEDSVY